MLSHRAAYQEIKLTHRSKCFTNENSPLRIGPNSHVFPFHSLSGPVFLGEVTAQLDKASIYHLGVEGFPQLKKNWNVVVDVERRKERGHDGDHDENSLEENVGI
jgi:hypothetical protein